MLTGRMLMTLISACIVCGASVRGAAAQCDPVKIRGSLRRFGYSVAVSGDFLAAGSPWESDRAGAVFVYRRSGREWTLDAKIAPESLIDGDNFGQSLSFSGDTVLIGATEKDRRGRGSAYVFRRSESGWRQEAKLQDAAGTWPDKFADSVSIDGDVAVVGASQRDWTGAAFVFRRNDDVWSLQTTLTAADGHPGDAFGASVALQGDRILIGAPSADRRELSGFVYVFELVKKEWVQTAKFGQDVDVAGFGWACSVDGDTALIGAIGGVVNAAYIFSRRDGVWHKDAKFRAKNGGLDFFGWSVAVKGNWAAVGAPDEEVALHPHGAAYFFRRTSQGWSRSLRITQFEGGFGWGVGRAVAVNQLDAIYTIPSAWDEGGNAGRVYALDLGGPCDTNCDGSVDLFDVSPFVRLLIGGRRCSPCAGDANFDGSVDLTDVEPFVQCLLNG